jgi:uncharacterized protein (TIGR02147 family)
LLLPKIPSRIFDYLDYREFMRGRYRELHSLHRSFSYQYIGRRIGLDSGTFSRVLNGERNLDPEKIPKLARVLGLDETEREYFECLTLFGQAKSSTEKNHFLEKLIQLRIVKPKALDERQYEFYREWYHLALWTLLNFYPFRGDVKRLGKMLRPPIRPVEAKKSLELLRDIGLVEEKDGKWCVTDRLLTSGDMSQPLVLNNLHGAMGRLALRSLRAIPAEERDFPGTMLTLSPKGFGKVKARLKRCREDVMEIARREEDPNCAFRLNLQFFPLSQSYHPGSP